MVEQNYVLCVCLVLLLYNAYISKRLKSGIRFRFNLAS